MTSPPPPPHPRHAIAIRPGALGDTLVALPALAWLRRQWPATRISFVARGDVLPLARASGLADSVSDYDLPQWADLFADALPASSPLRHILAGKPALPPLSHHAGTVEGTPTAGGARPVVNRPGPTPPHRRQHPPLPAGRRFDRPAPPP